MITSKYYSVFTKLGMCIDIRKSGLGLLVGKFCQFYDRVTCPPHDSGRVLSFHVVFC